MHWAFRWLLKHLPRACHLLNRLRGSRDCFCHRTCFCDYLKSFFSIRNTTEEHQGFFNQLLSRFCAVLPCTLFNPERQRGLVSAAGQSSFLLTPAAFPTNYCTLWCLTARLLPPVLTPVVRVLSGPPHQHPWWHPPEELRAELSKQIFRKVFGFFWYQKESKRGHLLRLVKQVTYLSSEIFQFQISSHISLWETSDA